MPWLERIFGFVPVVAILGLLRLCFKGIFRLKTLLLPYCSDRLFELFMQYDIDLESKLYHDDLNAYEYAENYSTGKTSKRLKEYVEKHKKNQ